MKKKKEIGFNPTDYEYMDNMPLEGWIWEVIRRSQEYRTFYEKWEISIWKPFAEKNSDDHSLFDEYLEKYSPIFPQEPDNKFDLPYLLIDDKKTKLRPLLTLSLSIGFGVDAKHGESVSSTHPPIRKLERNFNPGSYYVQEGGVPPIDAIERDNKTTYTVEDYPPLEPATWSKTPDGKNNVWFQNYPLIKHPVDMLYQYQGNPNMVMALIDLSASESIDDLLKSLKQELLLWQKRLKISKMRSAKTPKKNANKLIRNARIWKSYLIVYDLIHSGKSFKEASEILSLCDDFYSEVKNVENHYKNALALINGGYRKYL